MDDIIESLTEYDNSTDDDLKAYCKKLQASFNKAQLQLVARRCMLLKCRDAIASAPINAFGEGHDSTGLTWPIRDELVDEITKCLQDI